MRDEYGGEEWVLLLSGGKENAGSGHAQSKELKDELSRWTETELSKHEERGWLGVILHRIRYITVYKSLSNGFGKQPNCSFQIEPM